MSRCLPWRISPRPSAGSMMPITASPAADPQMAPLLHCSTRNESVFVSAGRAVSPASTSRPWRYLPHAVPAIRSGPAWPAWRGGDVIWPDNSSGPSDSGGPGTGQAPAGPGETDFATHSAWRALALVLLPKRSPMRGGVKKKEGQTAGPSPRLARLLLCSRSFWTHCGLSKPTARGEAKIAKRGAPKLPRRPQDWLAGQQLRRGLSFSGRSHWSPRQAALCILSFGLGAEAASCLPGQAALSHHRPAEKRKGWAAARCATALRVGKDGLRPPGGHQAATACCGAAGRGCARRKALMATKPLTASP